MFRESQAVRGQLESLLLRFHPILVDHSRYWDKTPHFFLRRNHQQFIKQRFRFWRSSYLFLGGIDFFVAVLKARVLVM